MKIVETKKLAAESRATGPTSVMGKTRSAINAVKHGLAGKNLLLPGDDPVEYAARMDALFTSLAPKDEGEAQFVALVADDMWKLGRLARIEKGVSLARIEELLAITGGWRSAPASSSTPSRRSAKRARDLGAGADAGGAEPELQPALHDHVRVRRTRGRAPSPASP